MVGIRHRLPLEISYRSTDTSLEYANLFLTSTLFPPSTDQNEEQSLGSSNIAELSPGAIDSCRSDYQTAFNSMMMERMTTDINALKKQYSRIKKKQQQQVHHVYIRAGNTSKMCFIP